MAGGAVAVDESAAGFVDVWLRGRDSGGGQSGG